MIEVRIRVSDGQPPVHLTQVPSTAEGLQSVIDLVNRWGVVGSTGALYEHIYGQIKVDHSGAYFEIVASDED